MELPDGLVAVVKRDCPTCQLTAPVLAEMHRAGVQVTVFSQDDPTFPAGMPVQDDTPLEVSYRLGIEVVPTLLKITNGQPEGRIEGWVRSEWRTLTGLHALGDGLPERRVGCGSMTVEPGLPNASRHASAPIAWHHDGSRSAISRTMSKRASHAAGPMACRLCRPPRTGC